MKHTKTLLIAAAAATLAVGAHAQTRGVTDDEIRIGGVHDLSGVFAAVSTPAVNGANLYFDMVNEEGGIHGRMINYLVEDHGYQLPRATQGFNKLIERDQVFAMLMNLGTPHNLTHYPLMERRGVPNMFPLTASRQILPDPPGMNFTSFSSYYDQVAAGVEYLQAETGASNVCAMYLPTDFGEEIATSARETAEALGMNFAGETTHRPDDQDFVGALSGLRAAECEIITMALGVRAGITVVGTAKRMGWDATFLSTSAGFLDVVAAVPGGVTDGLYAAAGWQDLVSRAGDEAPAAFMAAYEERFGHPASGFAMLGYTAARQLAMGLEAAGADLTTETLLQGMYTIEFDDELLGTHINFSADDHQGANDIFIGRVSDGLWHTMARIDGDTM